MKDAYYESAADRFEHFYLDYSTDNNTPAHYHNSVEIIVVAEGEFTARGNGEERTLHTGDVFFADNYVTHVYKTAFHSEAYVIVLSDAYLKNFHTRYGGTFPMFMYAGEDKNARLLSLLASAAEDAAIEPVSTVDMISPESALKSPCAVSAIDEIAPSV